MVFENVQYNPISIISKAEEEADIWFATNSPSGGVERRKTNVVQLVGVGKVLLFSLIDLLVCPALVILLA